MLQVSGEISLACSWRVTPLDVVTMKVKQQQAEVDHKEEILALLQVIFLSLTWKVPEDTQVTEPCRLGAHFLLCGPKLGPV